MGWWDRTHTHTHMHTHTNINVCIYTYISLMKDYTQGMFLCLFYFYGFGEENGCLNSIGNFFTGPKTWFSHGGCYWCSMS